MGTEPGGGAGALSKLPHPSASFGPVTIALTPQKVGTRLGPRQQNVYNTGGKHKAHGLNPALHLVFILPGTLFLPSGSAELLAPS